MRWCFSLKAQIALSACNFWLGINLLHIVSLLDMILYVISLVAYLSYTDLIIDILNKEFLKYSSKLSLLLYFNVLRQFVIIIDCHTKEIRQIHNERLDNSWHVKVHIVGSYSYAFLFWINHVVSSFLFYRESRFLY